MHISAWEIFTGSLRQILSSAFSRGEIREGDTVWNGPSGDSIVASTASDLEEEYEEYADGGLVQEYLDD